jgi:hypothetical protein
MVVAVKMSSGGVALDFAGPPRRLAGVIGGLAVLAGVLGIAVGEPVMDVGHHVFCLGQVCGHLRQTRTRRLDELDLQVQVNRPGRRFIGPWQWPAARG